MVRIGEKTGDLSTIFQRLSEYLISRQAIRDKSINSVIYPLFVLSVALIGIVLLATLVLPGLTGMIGSLNPQSAALYQRNVLGFQVGAAVFVFITAALLIAVVGAFRLRTGNVVWAERTDAFLLRVPLLKTFLQYSFGLNFSFAMETLLTSGYSLEDALEEGSWVASNLFYRKALVRARDSVVKGILLSDALRQEKAFPQVLIGWMAIGEGAHDLIKSFSQVRAYYQKETDKLYARFMNLAEPA